MLIQNNVLKQSLKNVYFVTGTPCGGKSTVCRLLNEWYSLPVYCTDDAFDLHRTLSDPAVQPNMNRTFADADEFFLRPTEEYRRWLEDGTREQLDFVLLDLVRLSANQKILCDIHLTVEQAGALTEPERIVFLLREPSDLVGEYCARPDHAGFRRFLESATDVPGARENCRRTLESLNRGQYEKVKTSGYVWLERDGSRNAEETARLVAAHFGVG